MPGKKSRAGAAHPRWRHWISSWLLVPIAVATGVLLFIIVWAQREAVDDAPPSMLPPVEAEHAADGGTLPAPQLPEEQDAAGGDSDAGGVFALPDAPAEPPAPVAGTAPDRTVEADDVVADAESEPASSALDRAPLPVHAPAPAYPRRAQRRGHAGEVIVQALVGPDGRPRQVEVVRSSSHGALDQAALRAVRQWRFEPAVRRGEVVAERVLIPITFSP